METIGAGRNLRFAENLSKNEIDWLVDLLNGKLSELHDCPGQGWKDAADRNFFSGCDMLASSVSAPAAFRGGTAQTCPTLHPPSFAGKASQSPGCERLKADLLTDTQPRDSRMTVIHEDGDVVFVKKGRWNWEAIGMALFSAVFVNSIVSLFLCGLFGWGSAALLNGFPSAGPKWWGMFLFLLPFEAVGLWAIGYLVLQLSDVWRVTSWRFSHDAVETGKTNWGIGIIKRFDVADYCKVEICEKPQRPPKVFAMTTDTRHSGDPDGTQFAVSLIDSDEHELCAITELTRAEAQWVRHHLTSTDLTNA
jgi:hypothetical protein